MEPTTKRRPIRGLLYGLVLGIGLTLIVVGQGIAALGTWPPFLVLIGGTIVGVVWSTMGPAKAPKGPAPIAAEVIEEPAPEPPAEPVAAAPAPEPEPDPTTDGGPAAGADREAD
ncbi:MAG: hypothetical protein AAF081_08955 [Actinomycetota bacterium]